MSTKKTQNFRKMSSMAWMMAAGLSADLLNSRAADFIVRAPAAQYYYTFKGNPEEDPVVTLTRGATHTFLISTNLVLTSTGTNTWATIPGYSTNLATTNRLAPTVQTNRQANGTNGTYCGRPAGDAVLLRFRSAPKTP